MKSIFRSSALFLIICTMLGVSVSAGAQSLAKDDLASAWKGMGEYTVALAELMPAEDFDYTPVEVLRTFSEQMGHITGSNYYICSILGAKTDKNPTATGKEAVISEMKESFEMVAKAIKGASKEYYEAEMDWFDGTKKTKFQAALFMIDHLTHTRGISLMYLRSKGIAPPDFMSY